MIVGGKKNEVSSEEYVSSAIEVFLCIANIFTNIFWILAGKPPARLSFSP
jgi:hypothetical protein